MLVFFSHVLLTMLGFDVKYTLDEARREAIRQSERQLEAQQALASAADQRAVAFCAILIVVVALVIQSMEADGATNLETIALTLFIISAVLAAFSAKPTRFYGSGGSVTGFKPYLNEHYFDRIPDQIGERNDEHLKLNDAAIKRSALFFKLSLATAFLGLLVMYIEVTGLSSWFTKLPGEPQ